MRIFLVSALLLSSAYAAVAQSSLRVLVHDERTKNPLPGVTVAISALGIGAATDARAWTGATPSCYVMGFRSTAASRRG